MYFSNNLHLAGLEIRWRLKGDVGAVLIDAGQLFSFSIRFMGSVGESYF